MLTPQLGTAVSKPILRNLNNESRVNDVVKLNRLSRGVIYMARLLEIAQWEVPTGREEEIRELGNAFSRFALKNLEAGFQFGFVQTGKYLDHASFVLSWENTSAYEKWQLEAPTNVEYQDWLKAVQGNCEMEKADFHELIQMAE